MDIKKFLLTAVLVSFVVACGGSAEDLKHIETDPVLAEAPALSKEPTRTELITASRLANRATYGLNYDEIYRLAQEGTDAWLEDQFARPAEYHWPEVDKLIKKRNAGVYSDYEEDDEYLRLFHRLTWWHCAIKCQDQLRQRVANALSQILVVSDVNDTLAVAPEAISSYYDVLLEHAFGNYRDLLAGIARHPTMGFYLSHLNNERTRAENNTFPDENFAREVMQLFTIGLYELNIDGSPMLEHGEFIPTYDNDDIREFAKIFTGFTYGGVDARFGSDEADFTVPMLMFDEYHEPGSKQLFATTVPAGQTGLEDFEQALDVLFQHPNVGPFIGKQLIQRLVTSNPSPAYVTRVAETFNDNGSNVRGDMQAVLRAILTDPEALADADSDMNFGKLREPLLRYVNLVRLIGARDKAGYYSDTGYPLQISGAQHPMSSPSVFNFYQPGHSPAGAVSDAGLVAPEFQILNTSTVVNMLNLMDEVLLSEANGTNVLAFPVAEYDFSQWVELAEVPEDLVEHLNIVLAQGNLQSETISFVTELAHDIDDLQRRAKVVIYMIMASADYVVEA